MVGTLAGARGDGPSIGLRADLDALHIEEKNDFEHRSQVPGKMHACGHDGHTSMLLGAAKYLAETRNFAGTVRFIFQPAEENEGGARVMVEEGLFEQFPMEQVFGMHNMPRVEIGEMAVRAGPMMAAFDIFEIRVTGHGTHAAAPHLGSDAIVAAAEMVTALQTIPSRVVDPQESVVVTVTQIHGGDTWNVIPEDVTLRGTVRAFLPEIQELAEASLRRIAAGIAATHGLEAAVDYERRYPPTINHDAESELAARVAAEVVGAENVHRGLHPKMAAEDFSFMLNERPGLLCLARQRAGRGRLPPAQPALRLPGRGAARRRELLGPAGRNPPRAGTSLSLKRDRRPPERDRVFRFCHGPCSGRGRSGRTGAAWRPPHFRTRDPSADPCRDRISHAMTTN